MSALAASAVLAAGGAFLMLAAVRAYETLEDNEQIRTRAAWVAVVGALMCLPVFVRLVILAVAG